MFSLLNVYLFNTIETESKQILSDIKKVNFRVYCVKELISQSRFSTDDLIFEKIPKLWTPALSLLSLHENALMKGIYGTTSSGGSRALQTF